MRRNSFSLHCLVSNNNLCLFDVAVEKADEKRPSGLDKKITRGSLSRREDLKKGRDEEDQWS